MRDNRYFLLAVLTIVGVFNFVDRQIIFILFEDIKHEFVLSDFQLSMLSGLAFAILYAILGIPVARLSERWHRGKIISLSLLVWSAMTAVSGLATGFASLAASRLGVGVGEAGVTPAAHSLLADRFEQHERGTAFAIFSLGGTAGIFVALAAGGLLGDVYGWRMTMVLVGLPGIVLAPVMLWAVRETRHVPAFSFSQFSAPPGGTSLAQCLAIFWRSRAWRYGAIATVFTHLTTYGIGNFLPSMMQRSYGMSQTQAGLFVAVAVGLAGTVGALSGGIIADRLSARRGVSWLAWTLASTYLLASIIAPFIFATRNEVLSLALLIPYFGLMLTSAGVQFALGHAPIAADLRATSSAVIILLINLVGLSVGPLITGQLSDLLAPQYGTDSLRIAMLIVCPLSFGTAWFYYLAGKALPHEVGTTIPSSAH